MNKFKDYLFSTLYLADDCPDGDAMFVSPEYIKWADEFEVWLQENDKFQPFCKDFVRANLNNCVTFVDNQQTIWFAKTPSVCPWGKWVISAYRHSNDKKFHPEVITHEP